MVNLVVLNWNEKSMWMGNYSINVGYNACVGMHTSFY
jgi:hypothetical protein